MKAKKLLAVCLTGSMIASCAAGCGTSSGGGSESSGKENITLRYWLQVRIIQISSMKLSAKTSRRSLWSGKPSVGMIFRERCSSICSQECRTS